MTKLLYVPVIHAALLPVLVRAGDQRVTPAHITDAFLGDLAVAYTPGPSFGQRLLTWDELDRSGYLRQGLRREAGENLYAALDRVAIHGQPPALMLSFDGLESSVLLAHAFWDDLAASVPGELVVGAPARDVVIFTGTQSGSGLRRVRRAVDRVFFAGGPMLLSRHLLVRRERRWELFEGAATPPPTSPMIPRPRAPVASRPAR